MPSKRWKAAVRGRRHKRRRARRRRRARGGSAPSSQENHFDRGLIGLFSFFQEELTAIASRSQFGQRSASTGGTQSEMGLTVRASDEVNR